MSFAHPDELNLLSLFYLESPAQINAYLATPRGKSLAAKVLALPSWHSVKRDLADNLVESNQDFSELFLDPSPNLVLPYAAHWFRESSSEKITTALRQLYKESDFEATLMNSCPDHISVLLAYLAAALDRGRAEGSDFTRDYLTPWLARFCDRLRSQAATELYRSLADLTLRAVNNPNVKAGKLPAPAKAMTKSPRVSI